jgi:hypothetical protein
MQHLPKVPVEKIQEQRLTNCMVQNLLTALQCFLLQENPFQRAARRQQRSGSLSSSSTAGENSDSTSSNTTSPSTSQDQHTAVDMKGIYCLL